MKPYILIITVIFVLCIVTVYSAPPVQTVVTSNIARVLTVAYPERTTFKLNDPFDLYFHIYDSNGSMLDLANKVNCTIHIYNKSNDHIVNTGLTYSATNKEFEYAVNQTALNMRTGFYPYIVSCNASNGEYGFVKYGLYITPSGEEDKNNPTDLWIIILIPLIFAFLLMKYGEGLSEDLSLMKLFLDWLALFSVLFSTYFALETIVRFYFWDQMTEAITWYNEIMTYALIVIVLITLIIVIGRIFSELYGKGKNYD